MLVSLLSGSTSASLFPDTYDREIKAAATKYWPGLSWKWWKAQLYQESKLDPNAKSGAGALGLAQFMGATWGEVSKQLGYGILDRRLAGPAIEGGAYYMAQLRKRWKMPDLEKQRFAQGGYNAGNGSIGRAVTACGGTEVWEEAAKCLPQITGKNSTETIGYIRSIEKWFKMMEMGK